MLCTRSRTTMRQSQMHGRKARRRRLEALPVIPRQHIFYGVEVHMQHCHAAAGSPTHWRANETPLETRKMPLTQECLLRLPHYINAIPSPPLRTLRKVQLAAFISVPRKRGQTQLQNISGDNTASIVTLQHRQQNTRHISSLSDIAHSYPSSHAFS